MDGPARNRIGLWLRGERAFGLSLVGPLPPAGANNACPELVEEAAASVVATARQPSGSQRPAPIARSPAPADAPARGAMLLDTDPTHRSTGVPETTGALPLSSPGVEQSEAPPLSLAEKLQRLAVMNDREVSICKKCRLCETRTHTVFGEGDPDAKIFFIGEGPGETEDLTGRPFVGRAGELLNKQIAAMGLRREQVFIANIVKCRPPGNRVPAPDEVATCTPYLQRQLEIVRPKVIVTLGLPAAKCMLQSNSTMGRLRGQWQSWRNIRLMPTYHPSYLLRSPTYENRSAVWSDLQKVMAEVGLPLKKAAGPSGG